MATAKLGAIIVQLAGSIGGTTFRRFQGKLVVSNKTIGTSKSRLLTNPKIQEFTKIIQAWNLLASNVIAEWVDQATNFQFPDKFGDLRNLNPRDFYTKLTSQLAIVNEVPDVFNLDSFIEPASINTFQINTSTSLAVIQFNELIPDTFVLLKIQVITNAVNKPVIDRRKIIFAEKTTITSSIFFFSELVERLPDLKTGDIILVHVILMNEFGFRASPIFAQTTVL